MSKQCVLFYARILLILKIRNIKTYRPNNRDCVQRLLYQFLLLYCFIALIYTYLSEMEYLLWLSTWLHMN